MIDAGDAVERLKGGGALSRQDLNDIKEQLSEQSPVDVYNLVRALALAAPASADNVALVARFLDESQDDWDLQGVIYALCHYWKLTGQYLGTLQGLLPPEKWRTHSSSATAAFSALGVYINETKDAAICRYLLEIMEQDLSMASSGDARFAFEHLAACYAALDRGVRGKPAVVEQHKFKALSDIRPEVVKQARVIAGV
ncbi:MAG: hypothetical protein U0R19_10830 [Bryobacteraceae bacterium]